MSAHQRCSTSRRPRTRRTLGLVLASCLAWGVTAGSAWGQAYPNKPIRFVQPSAAGGNGDIIGRLLGEVMGRSLGQPMIVENRSGASSLIGTSFVAKSPPDGYTLLQISSTFGISGALFNDLPYDSIRDFAPVGMIGATPILVVVNPGVPANSIKELIALAKSSAGKLNFSSTGAGSPAQLAGELLNSMAQIKLVHVPYKATAQATTDTIGGTIQVAFPSISSALTFVKGGKLRALAITSPQRSPIAPDIPTVAESLPGYEATIWNGILAPAGTPPAIITRLNTELNKALNAAEVKAKLAGMGVDVATSTPQEFGNFVEAEINKWRKVINASGIKVERER